MTKISTMIYKNKKLEFINYVLIKGVNFSSCTSAIYLSKFPQNYCRMLFYLKSWFFYILIIYKRIWFSSKLHEQTWVCGEIDVKPFPSRIRCHAILMRHGVYCRIHYSASKSKSRYTHATIFYHTISEHKQGGTNNQPIGNMILLQTPW
jgi:hypothetical protein